jgi:hypothetical protein
VEYGNDSNEETDKDTFTSVDFEIVDKQNYHQLIYYLYESGQAGSSDIQ